MRIGLGEAALAAVLLLVVYAFVPAPSAPPPPFATQQTSGREVALISDGSHATASSKTADKIRSDLPGILTPALPAAKFASLLNPDQSDALRLGSQQNQPLSRPRTRAKQQARGAAAENTADLIDYYSSPPGTLSPWGH